MLFILVLLESSFLIHSFDIPWWWRAIRIVIIITFAKFLEKLRWFVQWSGCLDHWQLWKKHPKGERCVLTISLLPWGHHPCGRGRLQPIQETYILTRTYWQPILSVSWMKFRCTGSKGPEGGDMGTKNSFSRVTDPTGQILLVNSFCNFMNISPLMSVYNLWVCYVLVMSNVLRSHGP